MNNTLQFISAIASIVSIPLAIYFSRKTNRATSEKARLDIIKTVSYKLSSTHILTYEDILSVYQSKIREHQLTRANFNIYDIVNDLKSDIMSNAFLSNAERNELLIILSNIRFPEEYTNRNVFSLIFKRFFLSSTPTILLIASASSLILANLNNIILAISWSIKYNITDIMDLIDMLDREITLLSRLLFAFFSASVILFIIHKYYKMHKQYTKI